GLTTVSMLFALAAESTASPSAISPHCMERENPIVSSWTSHRPTVEKYFADAPVSYARAAFARLQESFDRYAERWQNAQRSVCRGDHRSLVFDAQVRCLEDVHQSSQSLMHILSN